MSDKPTNPLKLTPEFYALMDKVIDLSGDESYSVVTSRSRGVHWRSIHVFKRQPNQADLIEYENIASKVKVKGSRTEIQGSQFAASAFLYDRLIDRVYNFPLGSHVLGYTEYDTESGEIKSGGPIKAEQARADIPPQAKRTALKDAMGSHMSEGDIADEYEDDSTTRVAGGIE